ncbi:P-loop containing nucleoside triphosphate hydrolase protein [Trematosphaeria pertusa]|uniref:RNA helicase n=1 Tax=Trematosphaeria pertusa TaxID=390896 RepID=A0A6A6IYS3_9PLEO|nr:P-loop containing nucleoside triphosphate hydrolase protein [Trematosphaeria pertusa]KAF2255721.1 P-loop containing nucleoside triphosphate hydrolase protein [Trematosphaeria pertusa]
MASRRADSSRSYYDDRGGGRYAPRRDDDRRDRYARDDRRDDRRDTRRRDDKYDRGREDRSRNERRDRDAYRRRSRSPSPRRDRSRDRYRDDRGNRYGRVRDYDDRDRDRDRRERDRRDRDAGRRNERRGSDDRRSTTSGADMRPSSRAGDISREERERREQAKKKLEEDAQKEKMARLEKWKKNAMAKKQAQEQAESPAAGLSPAITSPATPTTASTPPAGEAKQDLAKPKVTAKKAAEKKLKQVKEPFKLDQSAAARPAPFKSAAKAATTAATAATSVTNRPAVQAPKTNGNIGSFGLKPKPTTDEAEPTKKALLDDEENTGKRSLQILPDFTPIDTASPVASDGAAMSDIGSDDEADQAQLQARLEKRRVEIAEDAQMEEAPTADESGEKMDVDESAGAQVDDVDPLDAFMADLTDTQPNGRAPPGEALFNADHEPELTAVEGEDGFAMTNKKKNKREVPTVDHSKVQYEPFRKSFYSEPAEIAEMTPEEVADLRHELDGIKVKPDNVPRPVTKWAQMGLLQQTMNAFAKVRYDRPTPIQAQAIPIAESGRDLIGVAKTGSGKTLAFGIPMIRHIFAQRRLKAADGPIGLILAPTRELSLQIVNELKPFLKASNLNIACAYGGAPISEQIAMLKRGNIHVLCATAGRLIDLLQSNSGRVLNFKRVTYVVLDEADRMFDMGFEPQVMKILGIIRPDRQTILFSATFPKNMASLARKALTKPVEVIIGGRSVVAPEVNQVVELVKPSYEAKIKVLLREIGTLFSQNENASVLVFVERQETAEDLLSKLIKSKYSGVNTIHGAKDQTDRSEAINDFKRGVLPILIATSVAARGLDVPGLAMVFNFDCPTHLEDYVHRCGRTGRAGQKGTAITLIEQPGQERFAMHVAKALKQSGQEVPAALQKMSDEFNEKIKRGEEKWYAPGFGGKGLDKYDEMRKKEKRREKRALNIEGEEVSDDEPELPLPKTVEAATTTNGAKTTETAPEQPAYMQLLSNKIIVNKTERPSPGPSKPMTAKEKAMAAANKVDGRLGKKNTIHHGQPIDNKGPDAGAFHSTIEINDFPQKARWAVTNRTNVVKILDGTGVSITTKGNYYPPGKEPGENELPKLYILVEGETENSVTTAMMEITRLLREATMSAEDPSSVRGPTGRYSVV